MPAPRKPTAVLQLAGSFKHNPARGRAREREPEPVGAPGDPPARLKSEAARQAWAELVAQAPWATASDRWWLELACQLKVRLQSGEGSAADFRNLTALLRGLGVNPADRSRVQVPAPPAETNRFRAVRAKWSRKP